MCCPFPEVSTQQNLYIYIGQCLGPLTPPAFVDVNHLSTSQNIFFYCAKSQQFIMVPGIFYPIIYPFGWSFDIVLLYIYFLFSSPLYMELIRTLLVLLSDICKHAVWWQLKELSKKGMVYNWRSPLTLLCMDSQWHGFFLSI